MFKRKCKWLFTAAMGLSCLFLSKTSWANDYTRTKYPIVLVHGFYGFDHIGSLDYFYRIPAALRVDGAQVYVAQVSAANTTEVRGEELLEQVQHILAVTGAQKVNLIGHSHGGPTARYVAAVRPDLVASVTSVGGVHKGSKAADVYLGEDRDLPLNLTMFNSVMDGIARLITQLSTPEHLPLDVKAAMSSLSTKKSNEFNRRFPEGVPTSDCGEGDSQVHGVSYFSWTGTRSSITSLFDVMDPILVLTSVAFGGVNNDGLVGACSAHLGKVIRDNYQMNHFDEINQSLGLVDALEVNPITLYRQHANRLKKMGL